MAPDLEVNLSLLESTAGALSMLIEEFTNASDIESSYEAAVGEKNLVGALHSFASNWKAHREDMIKSMQDVYKMATGKMVSAGRAGRAFMEDNGLPGILYSLGSRSGFVKGMMGLFGKGPALDGAISAANDARAALTELVEDAKPTNLQSLWSWSKEAATEVGKLDILGGKLPDVARVTIRQGLGKGLYIADGGVQWGGFVASGGYNAHAIVTDTFSDEGVGQTLAGFRHMLSAVP